MRGITPIHWSPSRPDLNPTETVWQLIKQRLRARPTPLPPPFPTFVRL
jgi:transposase